MTISSVYSTLWRYRLFILLTTALLAGAAYFATTKQTKLYTASSLIRVQQRVTSANDIYGALQTGERLARTYAEIASTSSVARQALQRSRDVGRPGRPSRVGFDPVGFAAVYRNRAHARQPTLERGDDRPWIAVRQHADDEMNPLARKMTADRQTGVRVVAAV